jgi:hypothetical protein
MKKLGSKPQILLAAGSLALALTACRDGDNHPRTISPEEVDNYLTERGYRSGATPGSYIDPDGNPVSDEEAIARVRRATIRRGFGWFGIGLGGGS